jgi:hypothetical protein
VPFEGACAQGRLDTDHRVREPGARQAGDLRLLSGERVVGRTEVVTGLDTSSLAPGPLAVQGGSGQVRNGVAAREPRVLPGVLTGAITVVPRGGSTRTRHPLRSGGPP